MSEPVQTVTTSTPAPGGPATSVATGGGGVSGTGGGGGSAAGVSGGPAGLGQQLNQATAGVQQPGSVTVGGQTFAGAGLGGTPQPAPQQQQPAVTVESLQAELARVTEQARAAAQWAMYGQQQYAAARQAQQQPAAAATTAPATPANLFGIPKFDKGLLRFFRENPQTGELEPTQWAPPTAYADYQAHVEARRAAIEGFFDDPMKYLSEPIGKMIEERARAMAQGQIQDVQTQAQARGFVEQNADWLYARDQGGQVRRDIYGRPEFTPAGAMFRDRCAQLHEAGVVDVQSQQRMAMDYVLGQMAIARVNAQQQAQQQAAAGRQQVAGLPHQQQLLATSPPPPAPPPGLWGVPFGGQGPATLPNMATPGPHVPAPAPGQRPGRSALRNAMIQNAHANGVDLSQIG